MNATHKGPVGLVIMDGISFGATTDNVAGNAVLAAHTPNLDALWLTQPHTMLNASGEAVGLPQGQMGNSEVGHLNMGAGRCVHQELTRIGKAIEDGSLTSNPALAAAFDSAITANKTIHLLGLLSDGGVHSHINHLKALIKLATDKGAEKIVVHPLLDGRDVSPTSGVEYLRELLNFIADYPQVNIGTIMGRYYAMDRDKRWERTKQAHDALTLGQGTLIRADEIVATIEESYTCEVTDEFIEPIVIEGYQPLVGGDMLLMFNFRPDRARQIMHALTDLDFDGFKREVHPAINAVCLTEYDPELLASVAFPKVYLHNTLAEVLAGAGLRQLRIAETEKYAHVTFFFNGGIEAPCTGEERVLVPSPKVATYDLQPEMSAEGVTEELVKAIKNNAADFYLLNYANGDMVGHTGVFEAAIAAVETVDREIGKVVKAFESAGGTLIITADHGNAEQMFEDPELGGGVHTAHTTNPVPLLMVGSDAQDLKIGGTLADIAPTVVALFGIAAPKDWTGSNLVVN